MTIKKKKIRKKKIDKDVDREIISQQEDKINILENKFKISIYLIVCFFSSILYHLDSIGKPNYIYVYGSIFIVVPALVGAYLIRDNDGVEGSNEDWLAILGKTILAFSILTLWATWPIVELLRAIVSFVLL